MSGAHRAMAQARDRSEDGRGDDARAAWSGRPRACGCSACCAALGPDGSGRLGGLCRPARHHRRGDAAREPCDACARRAAAPRPRRGRIGQQLDPGLPLKDALPGLAPLHQRASRRSASASWSALLSAMLGVGGGFLIVPAMIYGLRMPTNVVMGTSLVQIIVITATTTILQSIEQPRRRRDAGAVPDRGRRDRRAIRRARVVALARRAAAPSPGAPRPRRRRDAALRLGGKARRSLQRHRWARHESGRHPPRLRLSQLLRRRGREPRLGPVAGHDRDPLEL